jgi:LacI family transcriptional regulator
MISQFKQRLLCMGSKITDIAKATGVSPATVSRVFSHHPYVKDEIRIKVLEAARNLNYAPKFSSAGNSIGIMVGGKDGVVLGSYESQLASGISRELFKHNCNIEITTDQQIPFLHANSFRALIVLTGSANEVLPIPGIPTLTVNNPVEGVHSVATDHRQGIEIAVDCLADKGHKKIAHICGRSDNWGNSERLKGYEDSLKKNGLELDASLIERAEKLEYLEAVARVMKKKPTAIIISGEGKALHLAYSLYLLDKKIPEDVSVISFEDAEVTPFLSPPQTTISQRMPELARLIAETTLEIEKDGCELKNIVIKNELIERESVKKIK